MKYSPDLVRCDIFDSLLSRCQMKDYTIKKHEQKHKELLVNIYPAGIANGFDKMIQYTKEFDWIVALASEIEIFNQTNAICNNSSCFVHQFGMEHGIWNVWGMLIQYLTIYMLLFESIDYKCVALSQNELFSRTNLKERK